MAMVDYKTEALSLGGGCVGYRQRIFQLRSKKKSGPSIQKMVQIGGKNVPATNITFQNWHRDQSKPVDPDQNDELCFLALEFGNDIPLFSIH